MQTPEKELKIQTCLIDLKQWKESEGKDPNGPDRYISWPEGSNLVGSHAVLLGEDLSPCGGLCCLYLYRKALLFLDCLSLWRREPLTELHSITYQKNWQCCENLKSCLINFAVAGREVEPGKVSGGYWALSDEEPKWAKILRMFQKLKWEVLQHLLFSACIARSGDLAFFFFHFFLPQLYWNWLIINVAAMKWGNEMGFAPLSPIILFRFCIWGGLQSERFICLCYAAVF